MAHLVSVATGNLGTAGTWNQATADPTTVHASTNINATTGADIFTGTFTAPNTTNACTGVVLFLGSKGSSTSFAITLQEDLLGTSTWADTTATVTITSSNLPSPVGITTGYLLGLFGTPYVFATTGANRYRFKIRASGATVTFVATGAGSSVFFMPIDNRSSAPGSSDTVWILGAGGITTTVTRDGSVTTGVGTDTTNKSSATGRIGGQGTIVGIGGVCKPDATANSTYIAKGNIIVMGEGEWQDGTTASPYPNTYLARTSFSMTTSGDYAFIICANGKHKAQGAGKGNSQVKYVSGLGTAASPLVVTNPNSANNWQVGDELIIGATSDNATNYNESEKRFIITVNSQTSFVVSSTSGGAESALTYTHTTDADVANTTCSVLYDTQDITKFFYYSNGATTAGNTDIDWARFETTLQMNATPVNTFAIIALDNSVIYRGSSTGLVFRRSGSTSYTYTNLIICYNTGTAGPLSGIAPVLIYQSNTYLTDCLAIANQGAGFSIGGFGSGSVLTRCRAISNGIGSGSLCAGLATSVPNNRFIDCESHCNRQNGVILHGATDFFFSNLLCGTKGKNQSTSILLNANSVSYYNTGYFENSNFNDTTFVSGYTSMLDGSIIAFQAYNDTTDKHFWYTPQGKNENTGAGLPDTFTFANGERALVMQPESSDPGLKWTFKVLVRANSASSVLLKAQKNATFGSDIATVNLYLPGSTTPDQTYTLANDTSEQTVTLGATYSGSVPRLFTVEVVAKSATASAKLYVGNIFNGTNDIINLDTWDEGQPCPVMFEQLGDASAVWQVLTSTLTTSGTIGNFVKKLLTVGKFLGLK